MAVAGFIVYLIIINSCARSQYTDDSDYKDLELYEEMPTTYNLNAEDDLYIVTNFEDNDPVRNGRASEEEEETLARRSPSKLDWYKPERVYRYTKHRIPGYDYEELDYIGNGNVERCDARSAWTHCVCQFTCAEPDAVDCYSPCKSGCECKEEYVYDEKTERCLPPEQCYLGNDEFYTG